MPTITKSQYLELMSLPASERAVALSGMTSGSQDAPAPQAAAPSDGAPPLKLTRSEFDELMKIPEAQRQSMVDILRGKSKALDIPSPEETRRKVIQGSMPDGLAGQAAAGLAATGHDIVGAVDRVISGEKDANAQHRYAAEIRDAAAGMSPQGDGIGDRARRYLDTAVREGAGAAPILAPGLLASAVAGPTALGAAAGAAATSALTTPMAVSRAMQEADDFRDKDGNPLPDSMKHAFVATNGLVDAGMNAAFGFTGAQAVKSALNKPVEAGLKYAMKELAKRGSVNVGAAEVGHAIDIANRKLTGVNPQDLSWESVFNTAAGALGMSVLGEAAGLASGAAGKKGAKKSTEPDIPKGWDRPGFEDAAQEWNQHFKDLLDSDVPGAGEGPTAPRRHGVDTLQEVNKDYGDNPTVENLLDKPLAPIGPEDPRNPPRPGMVFDEATQSWYEPAPEVGAPLTKNEIPEMETKPAPDVISGEPAPGAKGAELGPLTVDKQAETAMPAMPETPAVEPVTDSVAPDGPGVVPDYAAREMDDQLNKNPLRDVHGNQDIPSLPLRSMPEERAPGDGDIPDGTDPTMDKPITDTPETTPEAPAPPDPVLKPGVTPLAESPLNPDSGRAMHEDALRASGGSKDTAVGEKSSPAPSQTPPNTDFESAPVAPKEVPLELMPEGASPVDQMKDNPLPDTTQKSYFQRFRDYMSNLGWTFVPQTDEAAYTRGRSRFPTFINKDGVKVAWSHGTMLVDQNGKPTPVEDARENPNFGTLSALVVPETARGQKLGSSAMADVTKALDASDVTAYMDPTSRHRPGTKGIGAKGLREWLGRAGAQPVEEGSASHVRPHERARLKGLADKVMAAEQAMWDEVRANVSKIEGDSAPQRVDELIAAAQEGQMPDPMYLSEETKGKWWSSVQDLQKAIEGRGGAEPAAEQAPPKEPQPGWSTQDSGPAPEKLPDLPTMKIRRLPAKGNTLGGDIHPDAVKAMLQDAVASGKRFAGDIYNSIKPHLDRVVEVATDAADFMKRAVARFGEDVRPYARRYYGEFVSDTNKSGLQSMMDYDPGASREATATRGIWFSKMHEAAKSMPAKMDINHIEKYFLGKGVKADELKWSNLRALINMAREDGQKTISKDDVLGHIVDNGIKIEEHHFGGPINMRPQVEAGLAVSDATMDLKQSLREKMQNDFSIEDRDAAVDQQMSKIRAGNPDYNYADANLVDKFYAAERALSAARRAVAEKETTFERFQQDFEDRDSGRTDYRELSLNLPGDPLFEVPSGHEFQKEEANVNRVVHIRFNTRRDPQGRKVLFIEEIQSDWNASKGNRVNQDQQNYHVVVKDKQGVTRYDSVGPMARHKGALGRSLHDAVLADMAKRGAAPLPQAPDVSVVADGPWADSWRNLAIRRMAKYAVDNGFDRVSWTTGDMQNSRWIQEFQPGEVTYRKTGGRGDANRLDGRKVSRLGTVGGDPLRYSYDVMLPSAAKKEVKQFGAIVDSQPIAHDVNPAIELVKNWDDVFDAAGEINPNLPRKIRVIKEPEFGEYVIVGPDGEHLDQYSSEQEAMKEARNYASDFDLEQEKTGLTIDAPGFDVTPQMKSQLSSGRIPIMAQDAFTAKLIKAALKAVEPDSFLYHQEAAKMLSTLWRGVSEGAQSFVSRARDKFGKHVVPYAKKFWEDLVTGVMDETGAVLNPKVYGKAVRDKMAEWNKKYMRGGMDHDFLRLTERLDAEKAVRGHAYSEVTSGIKTAVKAAAPRGQRDNLYSLVDVAIRGDAKSKNANEARQSAATAMDALPAEVAAAAKKARQLLDDWTNEAIAIGAGSKNATGTMLENIGIWMKRSYRVFDDPNWVEKTMAGPEWERFAQERIKDHASQEKNADKPRLTIEEAKAMNAAMLQAQSEQGSANYNTGTMLGRTDMSTFVRRKNMPDWVREMMGEYGDFRVNFAKSAAAMGNMIANHEFLTGVKAYGEANGLIGLSEKNRSQFPDTTAYGPLAGEYVDPQFREVMESFKKEQEGPVGGILEGISGWMRFSKTAGNVPRGAFRQVFANMKAAVQSGHAMLIVTPQGMKNFAASGLVSINHLLDTKFGGVNILNAMGEMRQQGILDTHALQTLTKNQIKGTLGPRTKIGKYIAKYDAMAPHVARAGEAVDAITNAMGSLYMTPDNWQKVFGYLSEKQLYQHKVDSGKWTPAQLREHATNAVKDLYPTGSRVWKPAQKGKNLPGVADFIFYRAERVRNNLSLVDRIGNELNSSDPADRRTAMTRIAGLTLGLAGFPALLAMANQKMGATKKVDDGWRTLMDNAMPWMANDSHAFSKVGLGTATIHDIGFVDSDEWITNAISTGLRGDMPEKERTVSAIKELFSPYIGTNMALDVINGVFHGRDPRTGETIYTKGGSGWDYFRDVSLWGAKQAEPGIMAEARKGLDVIKGKRELGYWLLEQLGPATYELDASKLLRTNAVQWRDMQRDWSGKLNKANEDTDPARYYQVRNELYDISQNQFDKIVRVVGAAQDVGLSRNEVLKVLTDTGISKQAAYGILNDNYSERLHSGALRKEGR